MDFSIEISSDEDIEEPLAVRIARRAGLAQPGLKPDKPLEVSNKPAKSKVVKKPSSFHNVSDSDEDIPYKTPKKSNKENIEITPPPASYYDDDDEDTRDLPSPPPASSRNISPPSSRQNIKSRDAPAPIDDTEADTQPMDYLFGVLNKKSSSKSSSSSASVLPSSKSSSNSSSIPAKKVALSKEDKAAEKERKQEEKLRSKQEKEQEKLRAKALKEAEKQTNKQLDKAEVHKYVVVVIDPEVVSSPPGPDILAILRQPPDNKQESIFQFSVEKQPIPGAISWRRKVVNHGNEGGSVRFGEEWREEERCLLVISAENIALKVQDDSFEGWAASVKDSLGGKHVTLIIHDYEAYFKLEKNAKNRVRTAKVRGVEPSRKDLAASVVDRYKVEEALLTVSIDRHADHLTFDRSSSTGWRDLAGTVFHHTRAVAEAPGKLKKNVSDAAGFSFWAKADSKDCVAPKNLPEYWKQVIMQVSSGAGLEKAAAITRVYPSPWHLLEAYRDCSSVKEGESLLAGLEVRRTDNVLGGTRKIGPDISRRIYIALTSQDPDVYLSK